MKDLQSVNRLPSTGALGAASREAIRQINAGVGVGSSGAVVRSLQHRLVRLGNMTNGQATAASGEFDVVTEAAVRQLQIQHGIAATGIYAVPTYRSLLVAVPVAQPLVSTSGPAVDTVLPEAGRGFVTFNREPGGFDQVRPGLDNPRDPNGRRGVGRDPRLSNLRRRHQPQGRGIVSAALGAQRRP